MSFWTTCNEQLRGDTELRKIVGAPPRAIGRYRVLDILGQGGMGIVYQCAGSALGTDDLVALKLLKDPGADVNTLMREGLMLARLEHPNVARFRDFGFHDGMPFVVTRLYPAGNLMDWLKQRKRTWVELMPVLLGIAEGLAYIHQHGVLHLDVKPHNILMDRDGNPKIADFGISVISKKSETASEDSGGTARAYTRRYASPQQLRGCQVDARSDQYSFCRMIELDILEIACTAPPRQLQRVLSQGCAESPDNRFVSMEELIAALRQPRVRRGWWIAAASTVSLVVGGGAVAAQPLVDEVLHPCQSDSSAAAAWTSERSDVHAALQDIGSEQERMRVEVFLDESVETMEASRGRLCDRAVFADRSSGDFQRAAQCLNVHDWVVEAAIELVPHVQRVHLPGVVETLERLADDPQSCFQASTGRTYVDGLEREPRVKEAVDNLIRAELLEGFGDYAESLRLARLALDVTGTGEAVEALRGNAELQLGRTKLAQGDFKPAMTNFQNAEKIALKIHSHPLEMDVLNGIMEVSRGDSTISRVEALEYVGQAKQVAKKLDQRAVRVATFLKNSGASHWVCGEEKLALQDFEKALRLLDSEEIRSQQLRAKLQSNIAGIRMQEDPSGAVEVFANLASQVERRYGPTHPETLTYKHNYGEGLLDVGRHAEALAIYQSILEAESLAANPARLRIHTLPSAIFSAMSSGQFDQAGSLVEQLEHILPEVEGQDFAVGLSSAARYHHLVGESTQSIVYACDAARAYLKLPGVKRISSEFARTLGDSLILAGALDEATIFYDLVRDDKGKTKASAKLGLAAATLASDPAAASDLLSEAIAELEGQPVSRLDLARAYLLEADAKELLGKPEEASARRDKAVATFPEIDAVTKFTAADIAPAPACVRLILNQTNLSLEGQDAE